MSSTPRDAAGRRHFRADRGDEVPPLEAGDRLSRPEFERRYESMPHVKKAELVEGIVHMPSPVGFGRHAVPHTRVIEWLLRYEGGTMGVAAYCEASIRLDLENEVQPDAFLIVTPACGGQTRVSADDILEGAPELVAEVSSSSASYDLHAKLRAYQRNGVREYVVWRTRDRAIDWFVLRQGEFTPLERAADGTLRSEAFPGLRLDPDAMLAGDRARALGTLETGLASAEHAAFVERLASRATAR